MVCRMFQLRFKRLCPHNMFLSFCCESKNVNGCFSCSEHSRYFFSLSQVKKLVARVVLARSRDFLALKRSFETCPESGRDRMD